MSISIDREIKIREQRKQYFFDKAKHEDTIIKRLRRADSFTNFHDRGIDRLLDDIHDDAHPTSDQLQSALDAAAEGVEGAETF